MEDPRNCRGCTRDCLEPIGIATVAPLAFLVSNSRMLSEKTNILRNMIFFTKVPFMVDALKYDVLENAPHMHAIYPKMTKNNI